MKQKRSMDEAITAAKELRKNLTAPKPAMIPQADSHLKVVDSENSPAGKQTATAAVPESVESNLAAQQAPAPIANLKTAWVRHTVGLRDTTSLSLRDAADGQKRKERYGHLQPNEPANEQEIADLGISLALKQLGYLD